MTMSRGWIAWLVVLILASAVSRAGTEQRATAFVLCKNQKNVRTIRIMSGQNSGQNDSNCSISYTKGGVDEVVGANRSLSTCRSILKSIQMNLGSAGWSCRSVERAAIMTSAEVVRR